MAWRWPGNKPLSEPMMVSLLTHTCVTRLQWVCHDNTLTRCGAGVNMILTINPWHVASYRSATLCNFCKIDKLGADIVYGLCQGSMYYAGVEWQGWQLLTIMPVLWNIVSNEHLWGNTLSILLAIYCRRYSQRVYINMKYAVQQANSPFIFYSQGPS